MTENQPPSNSGQGDSHAALDALILEQAAADWEKIAVLMSRIFEPASMLKRPRQYDGAGQWIADRIYILVDSGRLDVRGNMRRWRDGEVKRKG